MDPGPRGPGASWEDTGNCVVDHNPKTISDAAAVTFSIKQFNLLKLYYLQSGKTSSVSGLLHTFFIYSRAFNKLISNSKSGCCNDTY